MNSNKNKNQNEVIVISFHGYNCIGIESMIERICTGIFIPNRPPSIYSGVIYKKYSMINATGNSMSPTIDNGDKLIVEHWSDSQIQDNKIYVFCFNNEFFVKRLFKNFDEIIIKSDNSEYRTKTISGSTINDMILIGKIVGVIKVLT